jgi:hypothetical protein
MGNIQESRIVVYQFGDFGERPPSIITYSWAQQNESQVEQSIELVHHGAGNEHRDFNMNREIRKLLNQD